MAGTQILRLPSIEEKRIKKGAIAITHPEEIAKRVPLITKYFYIIESYGGKKIPSSRISDIKLVENPARMGEIKKVFPRKIILNTAIADYVDSEVFRPINLKKAYTGIQISSWTPTKRPELFIRGVGLLPDKNFIKFGHFTGFNKKEGQMAIKRRMIRLSNSISSNIYFPYESATENSQLSFNPALINNYINQSKIGILTSKEEGCNIFKTECLSANIPFLVPSDSIGSVKKHINSQTGALFEPTPRGLAEGIKHVEENIEKFRPREYLLNNTGQKNSIVKLISALNRLADKDGFENYFDSQIYFERRKWSWNNEKTINYLGKIIDEISTKNRK